MKDKRTDIAFVTIILGATYFWSGISKCNLSYLFHTYPLLTINFREYLQALPFLDAVLRIGVPIFEISAGAALLLNYGRSAAVYLLIGMHGFLLILLGPFGLNVNSVVWPWNLTLIALLLFSLSPTAAKASSVIRWHKRYPIVVLGFLLFVLPLSSYTLGFWDRYPSFALYSGDVPRGIFSLEGKYNLPDSNPVNKFFKNHHGLKYLDLSTWSFAELNVPLYPETRVITSLARQTCQRYFTDQPVSFTFVPAGSPAGPEIETVKITCKDLVAEPIDFSLF